MTKKGIAHSLHVTEPQKHPYDCSASIAGDQSENCGTLFDAIDVVTRSPKMHLCWNANQMECHVGLSNTVQPQCGSSAAIELHYRACTKQGRTAQRLIPAVPVHDS